MAEQEQKQMAEAKKEEGNVAYKAKDYVLAVTRYGEAIELDETNHLYYSNRAAANLTLENYEAVIEDCEKCVELEPNFIKGYLRQAAALESQGKLDEALKIITRGLTVGKDSDKAKKELKKLAAKIKRAQINANKSSRLEVERALMSGGAGDQTKEVQRLQQELHRVISQAGKIKRDINAKAHELKVGEATKRQLDLVLEQTPEAVTYKAVGRMFLQQENKQIVANFSKQQPQLESELETLAKASEHFDKKVRSIEGNLRDILENTKK
uniref:Uncharacterized protein n=1 Tax=Aplanochytrium stocchinoi TaxID=215587 RepID=A0A6S8DQA5_9STRA|mmetsp:Transcript_1170/g.1489  ORF Transcript_1170/g.1489 Transcript_1170/m.1489 type:complete len:268 (+) Transcript_1170:160-963(+)|eukprot:CAMPEP_0204834752 /NCGR_PEP_ID=MMETSP1346-20131115/20651_1 /ASSEMBLY_ACC=CAM_ASM_000771 /TAXON_ID=215587 /ORGANISM="Aplanochytrium stocchinoi, Strain GSBS06" /LENGTH=267 /DNA_ID=CAMNT_0051968247 /DNA_START=177 /DNA_END=980 /DNA_ORIENTATION=+